MDKYGKKFRLYGSVLRFKVGQNFKVLGYDVDGKSQNRRFELFCMYFRTIWDTMPRRRNPPPNRIRPDQNGALPIKKVGNTAANNLYTR